MSSPPSAASGGSTSASTKPDGATNSSASGTSTGGPSSPNGSPESPSQMTSVVFDWTENDSAPLDRTWTPPVSAWLAVASLSSAGGSPAKTSASPDAAPASRETAPACSSSSPASLSLFDPAGYSSRTYPDCSPRTAVGTSESCLERWPTSGTAWRGGFSTAATAECPSADGACSSSHVTLADVLEPNAPARYSLSARAAQGILRRAGKRSRKLPTALEEALSALCSPQGTVSEPPSTDSPSPPATS